MKTILLAILMVVFLLAPSSDSLQMEKPDREKEIDLIYQWLRQKQGTVYSQDKTGKLHYVWWLTEKHALRIATVIVDMCDKYNDIPIFTVRQLWKETNCRWWVPGFLNKEKPEKYQIWGMGHVNLVYWGHHTYHVKNGKFAKSLLSSTNHLPKLITLNKRIDVGIEMRMRVMKYYREQHGYYWLALVAYWAGPNSKEFKEAEKGFKYAINFPYVKDVLHE